MKNEYSECIKGSEQTAWVLDEVLDLNSTLDMSKQFVPLSVRIDGELKLFSPEEIVLLSQLNAVAYNYLIHVIEKYIVDIVVRELSVDNEEIHRDKMRAMSRFLDEEVKHQEMFFRFNSLIEKNLSYSCTHPDNSVNFSKVVMEKSPLSAWLLTLQTELMTQYHYTEIFKNSENIEAKFLDVLKNHWYEESQHVRIDIIEIKHLIKSLSKGELEQAETDYIELLKQLNIELLRTSDSLIENFKKISGSSLDGGRDFSLQLFFDRTLRAFMIDLGLRHPAFLHIVKSLGTGMEKRLEGISKLIENETEQIRKC